MRDSRPGCGRPACWRRHGRRPGQHRDDGEPKARVYRLRGRSLLMCRSHQTALLPSQAHLPSAAGGTRWSCPRTRAASHERRYAGRPRRSSPESGHARWNLRRRRWHQGADVRERPARHARAGTVAASPFGIKGSIFRTTVVRAPVQLGAPGSVLLGRLRSCRDPVPARSWHERPLRRCRCRGTTSELTGHTIALMMA